VIRGITLSISAAVVAVLCSCQSGRESDHPGSLVTPTQNIQTSELKPALLTPAPAMANPYETRAWDVAEGERLFENFNCVGCHAHGGGSIGPPLMNKNWIYGSDPANIYASIIEGRPNGMPSFRGRIPDYQVWEIVAYVRSMSGQLPPTVAPARSDQMNVKKAEQMIPKEQPKQR
jgi:cytochrome c oxidase cbb3-type subunit III